MSILDDLAKIKQLDTQNMVGSLESLHKQVDQIWTQAEDIKIPSDYRDVNNIVVLGMGGSTLGAHVFKTLYKKQLNVPVEIINDYDIPGCINEKTLVIASSYSGTTEEVVNATRQAIAKKAKIVSICSGGDLQKLAAEHDFPALVFTTENNPSNQPRMGLGYSIIGQLVLLDKLELIEIEQVDIQSIKTTIEKYGAKFCVNSYLEDNQAKQIAKKTKQKSVWYIGSEHLSGNVHIAANQMNENAKRFAGFFLIPELNHHLLEGLKFPKSNHDDLLFVLMDSELYHERNKKRFKITEDVLERRGIDFVSYKCEESSSLLQVCEVLVLSSYISFYSAILNRIDPSPIPTVDYFKEQMK